MRKIILGDCIKVMEKIKDKSIDMILCDLPYGTTACKWDVVIPFKPLWNQYERIIRDKGAIVLFGSQPFTTDLINSNRKWFKYEWIWKKNNPTGIGYANYRPMLNHENILVFCKNKHLYNKQMRDCANSVKKRWKNGQKEGIKYKKKSEHIKPITHKKRYKVNPVTVLCFDVSPRSKGTLHPTQKPVALFEYLIKTYTNKNDIVLDSCAGSGTTGIACINLKRDFILIEKEKKYYKLMKERIVKYIKEIKIGTDIKRN